ncbi:MAG: hypothetical protein M3301_02320 [Chloroflexota bacterium]|nr:hypothetical protein [Chloroflexota bacterium]
MIVFAHAGHWLVDLAYFLPVVGFMGWLGWTHLRDRRRQRREGGSDPAAREEPRQPR